MMNKELAFETADAAFETARQMLTGGHYVVMLSREEQLWMVSYEYSDLCNRNDVVFMPIEEFYDKYCEIADEKGVDDLGGQIDSFCIHNNPSDYDK